MLRVFPKGAAHLALELEGGDARQPARQLDHGLMLHVAIMVQQTSVRINVDGRRGAGRDSSRGATGRTAAVSHWAGRGGFHGEEVQTRNCAQWTRAPESAEARAARLKRRVCAAACNEQRREGCPSIWSRKRLACSK
ncbi:unannotated protein [freshwater metagenome]|uniref:Unannotated protein n=1 Tax=freshwater metagenome TaxID=449393 RepID=A0A6J6CLH8_9ZZZZ